MEDAEALRGSWIPALVMVVVLGKPAWGEGGGCPSHALACAGDRGRDPSPAGLGLRAGEWVRASACACSTARSCSSHEDEDRVEDRSDRAMGGRSARAAAAARAASLRPTAPAAAAPLPGVAAGLPGLRPERTAAPALAATARAIRAARSASLCCRSSGEAGLRGDLLGPLCSGLMGEGDLVRGSSATPGGYHGGGCWCGLLLGLPWPPAWAVRPLP